MSLSASDWGFIVFAALAFVGSFGVVSARNPLVGALWLLASLFAVAGIFAVSGAHFLAAMQVLVYAGAVAVLFVFVIMLLNLTERELGGELPAGKTILLGLPVLAFLVAVGMVAKMVGGGHGAAVDFGDTQSMGFALLSREALPFEAISLLLVAAMGGAVMLTKRAQVHEALEAARRALQGLESKAHGYRPDPSQPFQFPPPARQEPPKEGPAVDAPKDLYRPGETV